MVRPSVRPSRQNLPHVARKRRRLIVGRVYVQRSNAIKGSKIEASLVRAIPPCMRLFFASVTTKNEYLLASTSTLAKTGVLLVPN